MAGRHAQIKVEELKQLVIQGLSGRQISERLGVTPGAISKALRKFKLNSKESASSQPLMDSSGFNTLDQLGDYISTVRKLIMILQKQIAKGDTKTSSLDTLVRLLAEGRRQLSDFSGLMQQFYSQRSIIEWQKKLIQAIRLICTEEQCRAIFEIVVTYGVGESDTATTETEDVISNSNDEEETDA